MSQSHKESFLRQGLFSFGAIVWYLWGCMNKRIRRRISVFNEKVSALSQGTSRRTSFLAAWVCLKNESRRNYTELLSARCGIVMWLKISVSIMQLSEHYFKQTALKKTSQNSHRMMSLKFKKTQTHWYAANGCLSWT